MTAEIKSIREFINGKSSDKQGLARNPFDVTVMSQVQAAQQSILGKMATPGTTEEAMVANAEKAIEETLQKINQFFEGKWKNYRQQVEGTKLNLFKEYKPL